MPKHVLHKKSKILVGLIIAIVVLSGILVGLIFFKDSFSLFTSFMKFSDKPSGRIYFGLNNKLNSVDVVTKDVKVIDEGISTLVTAYQIGSQYPLNAKNFSKVAYIKDNSVWIYDGSKSVKIDQPDVQSKTASSVVLSTWSPKSDYLVYYITDGSYAVSADATSDLKADSNTSGAYVYSLASNKSTRIPQVSKIILGWVPGTTNLAYINPEKDPNGSEEDGKAWNNVHYYDVKSNRDKNYIQQYYTGELMRFSDDGSRILYSGVDTKDEKNLQYLISKPDLNDPSVVITLPRSQVGYLSQDFVKGSYKQIVYSVRESVPCDGSRITEGTTCYAQYLKTTLNDKKTPEVIDWYGFYDYDKAVVLTGLDYTTAKKTEKALVLYNVMTGESEQLYKASLPMFEKPLLAIGDSLGLHSVGR